jgi:hypothetical protein
LPGFEFSGEKMFNAVAPKLVSGSLIAFDRACKVFEIEAAKACVALSSGLCAAVVVLILLEASKMSLF